MMLKTGFSQEKQQPRGEAMSQTTTYAGSAGAAKSEIEISTIRAISLRLIPFLVLAYFFSYLDRVNLGFAALTMNVDLKFTPLVFAWGAGIFFIGYFLFEVPSNLALEKFGAHLCRVLDAADGVALRYGRGRRHRADKFDRQPRGFWRTVPDRLGEGSDRQRVDGIAGAVAIATCGRAARLPRRSRDKDRVRRGEVSGLHATPAFAGGEKATTP